MAPSPSPSPCPAQPLVFDVELIAVMDDLLDRGDYDDGDVSDLRLDLREAASTRAASTG